MLEPEIDSYSTRVPVCLLQLLHDLGLLKRSVNEVKIGASPDIEQLMFTVAAFDEPAPRASEWYAIYEFSVRLLQCVDEAKMGGCIQVCDAFSRVAQFVQENEDLALEGVLR